MATFKQYELKNGEKKWLFKTYLGTDPVTGRELTTTRRGYRTKKEAQINEKRLQYEVLENGFQKSKTTTFQEVYELWFEQYKNTVKESTWAKTKEMFKQHIIPAYGSLKIDDINVKYCQKTINKWFKHTKTKYKRLNNYTSNVFDYAIALEIINDNPTKKITIPKVKQEVIEETEHNFYTKEELTLFLNIVENYHNKQAYPLFRLLSFTGLRQGESLALTWHDIDFNNKTLTVNKTLTRGEGNRLIVLTPKTKKSARTISLDDKTLNILKLWRKEQQAQLLIHGFNTLNKKQLVFSNSNNTFLSPAKPRQWLLYAIRDHNIKSITIHGFRHTHCSLLFEAGASIQEVQERLGHGDIKTTMNIYNHVSEKIKEETAQKFANYIGI